jgi:hypothetical protein
VDFLEFRLAGEKGVRLKEAAFQGEKSEFEKMPR